MLRTLAGMHERQNIPIDKLIKSQLDAFFKALKSRLNDKTSHFGKAYMQLLVDEVIIDKKQAIVSGSYIALAEVARGTTNDKRLSSVPIFTNSWRARRDSNPQPSGSKSN